MEKITKSPNGLPLGIAIYGGSFRGALCMSAKAWDKTLLPPLFAPRRATRKSKPGAIFI
jgi:hypothetical protein